jgi:hypothetical protein
MGAAAIVLSLASLAGAQQSTPTEPRPATDLDMRAPAPPPKPEFGLERTRPREETGGREQEFHPGVPLRSQHDPAFVTPFVSDVPMSTTTKARVGLSGWTAPAIPFDSKDGAGGLAFGFTIIWDVPVTPAASPEPESPPTGQR